MILRDVEVAGRGGLDVRIEGGRVAAIGPRLAGRGAELDGRGGALIPGLIDHHIHILATAARADSVALETARGLADVAARIGAAAARRPAGAWIRAVGYHEGAEPLLDAMALDRMAPRHPLRVQHRSGSLWILNSRALGAVLRGEPAPACVERGDDGRPTGRIWRGDAWLGERLGRTPPPLAPLGARLAAYGVTGLTDTSANTDAEAAAILAAAHANGDLPQRLMLMSGGDLEPPPGVRLGPVKVLLDEARLPDLDALVARIAEARDWGRGVAMHCATATELAFALAAFEAAGARPGDRIEHGSVIAPEAVPQIARLGLTVVTQPGFVAERGDRYLAEVPVGDHDNLYRLASLKRAGVRLAASSDAPYGEPDPWTAMRAAVSRRTASGAAVGEGETLAPAAALSLYLGGFARPGGRRRRVAVGARADLCLLSVPRAEALRMLDTELVAATLVDGRVVFERAAGRAVAA
ncbi:MAG: amidohydrolase family protein [Phenylobacterium sp.]|nr:amidohydrolase family protein [Phenylobacterium sp.]